jgi:NAD(P)-dependent dehydrogenase (short-subunit alcohol dehydrogenase family)
MAGDFDGRVALVTGGTRGIGFGIAAELAERGARVCVTARKPAELDAAVQRLGGVDRAIGVRGSADDVEHQADAVAQTAQRFGPVEILVNNAGINPQYGPLVDADLAAVRKVFEVNVTAVLGWVQAAWRAGMAQRGGAVLNIASVGGLRPGSMIGAYNTSKAALIHLTRQLALELAPRVRVNAIAPAVVKTDFAKALYEGKEAQVARAYPLGRLGTPSDTAKLAAFLLSDAASWITGDCVIIDGGVTLGAFL